MGEWASGAPFGRVARWFAVVQTDLQRADSCSSWAQGARGGEGPSDYPSDSNVVRMRGRGKAECAIGHGWYVAVQFGKRGCSWTMLCNWARPLLVASLRRKAKFALVVA